MIEKESKSLISPTLNRQALCSAREGLLAILRHSVQSDLDAVLLVPAYIGWSPNEGSGLMDPIVDSQVRYNFYPVSEKLLPITESLNQEIMKHRKVKLLLVHYFGMRSILHDSTLEIINSKGHGIIEDWAHDLSRFFEPRNYLCEDHFELFSIHKWTASHAGGLVRGQVQLLSSVNPRGASVDDLSIFVASDISEITNIRWRNYLHIDRRLADSSKLQRFWSSTQDVSCPLNFPIVLNSVSDRSELYSLLISKGLKPTSLYHKLTQYLDAEKFPSAYRLADTILNLPVHQDCSIQDIDELVNVINEWALVSS
jgi:hypothetical protein